MRDEETRISHGAPARPGVETYSAWREELPDRLLSAFDFYASYLAGQTNGMSDALSLPAVVAACEIDGVPMDDRPKLTRLCIVIHGEYMTELARRERMNG